MGTFYPVIGAPRTGTSLVACLIHTLGASMGEQWAPMSDPSWAPDHFYADAEFALLHDKLMMNTEVVPYYGMPAKNPEHWPEYQSLVKKREATYQAWGFKEVMLQILWPSVVPLLTHTISPIFTTRNTAASDASWHARAKLKSVAEATNMLLPFRLAVGTIQASYPDAYEVNFDELVDNPVREVDRLSGFLNVGKLSPRRAAAVAKVLSAWRRF